MGRVTLSQRFRPPPVAPAGRTGPIPRRVRRATTVLVTTVLTAGGMAAPAPPASAAELVRAT